MDINGYQWISMDLGVLPNFETQILGPHPGARSAFRSESIVEAAGPGTGVPVGAMGRHGPPWAAMGRHGPPWAIPFPLITDGFV